MRPHLAARIHAFFYGLFRSSDETEARQLFEAVHALFEQFRFNTAAGRNDYIKTVISECLDQLDIASGSEQSKLVTQLIIRTFEFEGFFVLPDIDWTEKRSTAEWWAIRDELLQQKGYFDDFDDTHALIRGTFAHAIDGVLKAAPNPPKPSTDIGISVPTSLIHSLANIGNVADHILEVCFARLLKDKQLFTRTFEQLQRNLVVASGGNANDITGFTKTPVYPSKSQLKDNAALAEVYFANTPLLDYLQSPITFMIPTSARFEHHHIIAGSGHGKTQALQYLIVNDLEAVAAGKRSIIVLDSQGDLIRNISNLAEFGPNGALHDRVVIIDPTDVEYPVSLNLFDVGIERLSGYAPLERERLTNSILELYDFVLGTLLAAEMTQKQNVIFRYVTRLMLHIPGATIHTLRELMEPDSHLKFSEHIEKLEGSARHFFDREFNDKEFSGTRKQVLRRLWGILENQTFERMFSHPKSKLDLFAEMNDGKVILINTAKDLLKEQGSQIFGRFFIALIAQAAQERATLPANKRMPTLVYIDEAQDYFDRNIGIILAQARKYNVGMVLAHQYLGQLDPKLQDAFAANTAIKFAGGVSAKDARTLAPMLHCEPSLIETQSKGSFATFVRGETKGALPLQFPLGFLEKKPVLGQQGKEQLQEKMRDRYAVHHSELATTHYSSSANDIELTNPSSNPDDVDLAPGKKW